VFITKGNNVEAPSIIHPKQFKIKTLLFTIKTNHAITDKEAGEFAQWAFDTHFSKYTNAKPVTVTLPNFRNRMSLDLMVTATNGSEEKS